MKEVQKMVNEEKKKYTNNKNANNTLNDLKKFFCDCEGSANPSRKSFLLRKTIHEILRNDLEKLVIKNSQIQLRNEYMIYLKTQSLRCRNKTLMCRLKARWFIYYSPIYLIILLDFFFLLPRFVKKFKKSLSDNLCLALINYDTLMIYFVHKSLKHEIFHFCEFSSFLFEKLLFN